MCSEKQRELYAQFEPDANEVVFGQRTAPDRPLTHQELSKRKRTILKLVDQKLKFELIELMRKQQEQTLASNASSTPTSSAANSQASHDWVIPSNFCGSSNQQNESDNGWQPPQKDELHVDATTRSVSDSRVNFNLSKVQQNQMAAPVFHLERQQPNPNLIEQFNNTKKKCTSTAPSTMITSKEISIPAKEPLTKGLPSNMEQLKVSSLPPGAFTSRTSSLTQCNQHTPQKTAEQSGNSKNIKNPLSVPPMVELPTTPIRGEPKTICDKRGAPLIVSTVLASRETTKRKPEESSNENCTKKILLMNEKAAKITTDKTSSRHTDARKVADEQCTVNTTNTQNVIDLTNKDVIGENHSAEKANQSKSMEWTAMDQWVTSLFRNRSNNWAPLSASDFQLKNLVLMQMSINPDAIRSHPSAGTLRQRVGVKKFDELIHVCKTILINVSRTDPEKQAYFSESQKKLAELEDLKEWNCRRETASETLQHRGIHSKIASLLCPFLIGGKSHHDWITELIKNPYLLLSNEMVKYQIIAKGHSVDAIMKSIKSALDEFISPRLPKKFQIPVDHFVDVPFVVNLFNRTARMTTESATELTKVLLDSINCLKVNPKPSLRDIKFKDGALEILCKNSMSFEWLENTLSNHLGVSVRPVKNAISNNQLKTIGLKFHAPQYLHFNNLMEELRVYNPRLLTRRWEQRSLSPNNLVDSTKCVYVGVDVESLIALEDMNRAGTLRDTSVYFEISYDDNEENFKKMTFVKKTKKKQRKYKINV